MSPPYRCSTITTSTKNNNNNNHLLVVNVGGNNDDNTTTIMDGTATTGSKSTSNRIITVFVSDDDFNSKRVTRALRERGVSFREISVTKYPSKVNDLKALVTPQAESIPQVFVNDRYVGDGVDDTIVNTSTSTTTTTTTTTISELLCLPPDEGQQQPSAALPAAVSNNIPTPSMLCRQPSVCIELLDGTSTTYWDIADKVKNTLPQSDISYDGTLYKDCFRGDTAHREFQMSMDITEEESVEFGNRLLKAGVMHCLTSTTAAGGGDIENEDNEFKTNHDSIYRLQCQTSPDVLNSYRVWNDPIPTENITPLDIVDSLDTQLRNIELNSVASSVTTISYSKAILDPRYPMFEESICELQQVDMSVLDDNERKAFSLNVYKLMLRYALLKIGITKTEQERVHFLKNVKFNIGGQLFSFQEWLDGILRSNSKVTFSSGPPFTRADKRREVALPALDYRIHFAIHTDAMFGSKSSLPFERFTPDNINDQLDIAARVFCSDENNVSITTDEKTGGQVVQLSKVFSWYRSDFGYKKTEILSRILPHLVGDKQVLLKSILSSKRKDINTQVQFVQDVADWTVNASSYNVYNRNVLVGDVQVKSSLVAAMLGRRFKPPVPTPDESLRLSTLHGLNMLDTLPEERFDRITRMAKDEFDVPLCFVSLIDSDRQVFKSTQWECPLPLISETSRDISFCGHAIHGTTNEVLLVEDTLEDDRFADNPVVTGPLGVRFYAGAPLAVPDCRDGTKFVSIGTLCILDVKPRQFSDNEKAKLCQYANDIKEEVLRRNEECDDEY